MVHGAYLICVSAVWCFSSLPSLVWPLAQELLVKEQLHVYSFNTLLWESILKQTHPVASSINTWVSTRAILLRQSLLFKKKSPCEPTYWIHGKPIRRSQIRESQKEKCRSRKEEAVYTYAVKILQQWLLEPVTHEIWETAALSTIYRSAREKEKRWRKQPHHIHSGAELVLFFFSHWQRGNFATRSPSQ